MTDWLGPILIKAGHFMQDEAMVEKGRAILDAAIENELECVLFSKRLTYAGEDVHSLVFQNAFEAPRYNPSACGGEEVGGDDDVTIEANFEDPACSNHFERKRLCAKEKLESSGFGAHTGSMRSLSSQRVEIS